MTYHPRRLTGAAAAPAVPLVAALAFAALTALAALAAGTPTGQRGAARPSSPITSTLTATPASTPTLATATATTFSTSTVATTATAIATASITATPPATPTLATATTTETATATTTETATATTTETATVTTTATATAVATASITATTAPTPTAATATAPAPVLLPYAASRDEAPASVPQRVWGAQLAGDDHAAIFEADALVELPRMHAQGLRSLRTHVHWTAVEPEDRAPGAYDFAATDRRLAAYAAAGFDVVASVVDYPAWAAVYRCGYALREGREPDWRELMTTLAARYSRPPYSVIAWEIGNEVDGETTVEASDWERTEAWGRGEPTVPHGGCWGDRPEAYARFLGAAAEAVRAAAPRALVTLGNLALVEHPDFHADFLDGFLAAGGAEAIDYVGFHWFPDLAEFFPDQDLPDGPTKVGQVAATLRRHGVHRPIWLTETYRLTREGDASSEARQLEFVTRGLVELAARTPLARVYWYGWRDFAGVAPGAYQRGLVRADHAPKPALASGALRAMIQATDGVATDISTADVVAFRFRPVRGGADRVAAWSRSGAPGVLRLPAPAVPGTVAETVRFVTDGVAVRAERAKIAPAGGVLAVPVGAETTFIFLDEP